MTLFIPQCCVLKWHINFDIESICVEHANQSPKVEDANPSTYFIYVKKPYGSGGLHDWLRHGKNITIK